VRYPWPGNVRELRNTLERAVILCDRDEIDSGHLVLESPRPQCQETTDLVSIERDLIAKILRQEHWNKARAARILGITRTQLYCRLHKHGLTP
jgi:DNA-binding NtrC family response regulator